MTAGWKEEGCRDLDVIYFNFDDSRMERGELEGFGRRLKLNFYKSNRILNRARRGGGIWMYDKSCVLIKVLLHYQSITTK
jgi:hypothetical protein